MMLGKRPRHPIKRTTSMTEFSIDNLTIRQHQPYDQSADHYHHHQHHHHHGDEINQKVMAMVSPSNTNMIHRRNSADSATLLKQQSPSFLNSCSLCNRRLPPGRDIYMYRGDSAFCSLECRQQQMTQDDWKEKTTSSGGPLPSSTAATQSHCH